MIEQSSTVEGLPPALSSVVLNLSHIDLHTIIADRSANQSSGPTTVNFRIDDKAISPRA